MNQFSDKLSPLLSVILPIRNAESYLSDCLDSLINQNYSRIEIIAIDDYSTDKSWKILRKYRKLDNRLKIFRNVKKYGLAITLNRCLKRAKGKFIVFMDARDSITKNKFQKQLLYLMENQKVVAVGTQCIYLSDKNKRIGKSSFPSLHEDISEKPLHGISVLFEGIMINKYRIPKDLLYFPTYKHLFLYTDMAMKLLQYGKLANLSEYLHFHRKHDYAFQSGTKHVFSLFKLWVTSRTQYEISPSLRGIFSGILKPSTS